VAALDAREQRERAGRENANAWRIERKYEPFPALSTSAYTGHLKPMVLLTLNTGIRQGELLKLRWDALNLNKEI
jgi:integrase